MKIALTGASGTIGSLVADSLQRNNIDYVPLSRTNTDYSVESLKEAFSEVNLVVHLAAVRGRGDSYEKFSENARITENILKAMALCGTEKIIFFSSNAVYKDEALLPWREDQKREARTFYGLSKVVCEELIEQAKVKGIIFRCAPVISAKNAGFMIANFINQALNKETLNVDHSVAKRSFIYEKDAANAVLWAMNQPLLDLRIYNLAMEETYTNLEIAEVINSAFENDGNLVHHLEKPEGTVSAYMDVSKLAKDGFIPEYDMLKAVCEIYERRGE